MNMTEKNGQPSMEEILASIRRIIAEEPGSHHNGELRGTPILLKGDGVLDDAGDFDLPAIFRSSPPVTSDRQTPLLGRLTDAIRNATTAQPAAASEETHYGEPVELAAAEASQSYAGLSSLQPVRASDPASVEPLRPGLAPAPAAEAPFHGAAAASSEPTGVAPKRVMAPFKDTHFLRMTAPTGTAAAASEPPPAMAAPETDVPVQPFAAEDTAPVDVPVDFGAIVPGHVARAGLLNGVAFVPSPIEAGEPAPYQPAVAMPPPPLPSEPSQALTVTAAAAEETGTIEDTTADLLRPMLRQWLADNMPRMVEKALHIEIAESVKVPKKP